MSCRTLLSSWVLVAGLVFIAAGARSQSLVYDCPFTCGSCDVEVTTTCCFAQQEGCEQIKVKIKVTCPPPDGSCQNEFTYCKDDDEPVSVICAGTTYTVAPDNTNPPAGCPASPGWEDMGGSLRCHCWEVTCS